MEGVGDIRYVHMEGVGVHQVCTYGRGRCTSGMYIHTGPYALNVLLIGFPNCDVNGVAAERIINKIKLTPFAGSHGAEVEHRKVESKEAFDFRVDEDPAWTVVDVPLSAGTCAFIFSPLLFHLFCHLISLSLSLSVENIDFTARRRLAFTTHTRQCSSSSDVSRIALRTELSLTTLPK